MSDELLVLVALVFSAVLGTVWIRRLEGEPSPWWGAAWVGLIASAIASHLGLTLGSGFELEWAIAPLFPFLTLAGAFQHAGRPVPRLLLGGLLAYVGLRAALFTAGLEGLSLGLSLVVEPGLLLCAAWVVRAPAGARALEAQRLLPLMLAAVAIPRALDTLGDFRPPAGNPVLLWFAFGWPLALVQLVSRIEVARRTSRAASDALDQTLRRFEALAESAFDLIAESNAAGRLRYASPSFKTVLGYEPSELMGLSGLDLVHPEDLEAAAAAAREFRNLDSLALPPVRVLHRDGSWRWLEGTARRYQAGDGESRAILVGRDVTARLRAQAALRSSEERMRALGEHSNDVIVEIDPDGRVAYVSANLSRVLGYAPREIVGLELTEVARRIGAERPQDALSGLAGMRPDGGFDYVCRVRRKDGSTCWIENRVAVYPRPDGRQGIVSVTRDITERRLLDEKLRQSERLESLGRLAGGVAHDFNNLLTPILGNASLLRRQLPPDLALHALTRDIEQAARRAGELTHQLLAYTGRSQPELEPIRLSELVEELCRLFEKTTPKGVTLCRKVAEDLPPIQGDPVQVRRVIMNILANAVEALGDEPGEITISTAAAELRADDLASLEGPDDLEPGRYVVLEVADPGSGIAEGARPRIFDPFFTTKPEGHGLGLAELLGIARSHRAGIDVRSAPGQGTRFRVFFPQAVASLRPRTEPPRAGGRSRQGGLVLVADDEDAVRRVALRALRRAGFETVEARDGHDAVDLFRRRGHEIVAVLLDVTMPRLRGDEAYLEMRKIRPQIPVVFTSGFSHARLGDRVPTDGRLAFLEKPYAEEDLLERLKEVLG
jgi:two-component system cell cycle sensor histidine kinase/response regulator CckA